MPNAKIVLSFILLLVLGGPIRAQKAWTLEECISHAHQNNLNLKLQEINVQNAKINLTEARMQPLPSLNASVNQGYNFGRSIDPFTNQFVVSSLSNSRVSLSTGVTLFNGFQIYNTMQSRKHLLAASKFDLEVSKNDLGLNIANAYLQVLFAKELVKSNEARVQSSEVQLQTQQKFKEAGRVAENAVLDMEAQVANDRLNLVNAQNQLTMAKLTLFQFLDLNPDSNEVATPALDSIPDAGIFSADQLYTAYLQYAPELKAANSRLESGVFSLRAARGAYYPRLMLGADINTVYSESNLQRSSTVLGFSRLYDANGNVISTVPVSTFSSDGVTPFSQQLSDNLGQTVGFSLSIPIFNNYRTLASVKRARLNYESTRINSLLTENTLKRQITQAYTEYMAAKSRYTASKQNRDAQKASLDNAEKRLEANLISIADFRILQSNFQIAETNYIQAKYELMFRYKIIDFYKHGSIKAPNE